MSCPVNKPNDAAKDADYWLSVMLDNWARWMRAEDVPDGLPTEACGGILVGFSHESASECAYEKLDLTLAEKTNSAIEGLPLLEQIAIYIEYGIATSWYAEYSQETLSRAKQSLIAALIRRDVWLGD